MEERIEKALTMSTKEKKQDFSNSYFKGFKDLFPSLTKRKFLEYYSEDQYGGFPEEPGGSVWESEGKSIYVLTRILKPRKILEIGSYLGKSSNHILQAVEANQVGEVTLLDIEERIDYSSIHNKNFNRILKDSLVELEKPFDYDLIIQDGDHRYTHVKKELELILANSQSSSLHIWAHDYYVKPSPGVGVGKAWDEAKDEFSLVRTFIDSQSDCGFVIARR